MRADFLVVTMVCLTFTACGESPDQQCQRLEKATCDKAQACGSAKTLAQCLADADKAVHCDGHLVVNGDVDACIAAERNETCEAFGQGVALAACTDVSFE